MINKTKKLVREAIFYAIDSIKEDICRDPSPEANNTRAEAIEKLAKAWKEIR